MKKVFKINADSRLMYVDKEVLDAGFTGDVPALMNALTLTLIKPDAKLEDVKRSLEIAIQDIDLRIKQGDKKV